MRAATGQNRAQAAALHLALFGIFPRLMRPCLVVRERVCTRFALRPGRDAREVNSSRRSTGERLLKASGSAI